MVSVITVKTEFGSTPSAKRTKYPIAVIITKGNKIFNKKLKLNM